MWFGLLYTFGTNFFSPGFWVSWWDARTRPLELSMNSKNRPPAEAEMSVLDHPRVDKKPYKKPEFRFEKVFETMALACGKIAVTQQNCRGRRRRSS
jgi:hypothetical protein